MEDESETNPNWSLYPYEPNQAGPIAFTVILAIVACYQVYQSCIKYHWKVFGLMMTWASTVWLGGFVCRAISVRDTQNVDMYIAQFVLVLMGPPLYAAAEYFILGRLLAYLPYHSPVHPGRVISTFLFLSSCVEALTANGAANSGGGDRDADQRRTGIATLKAALILQCCVELFFISITATVQYRCHRAGLFPKQVRPVFYILYLTSTMVLVRCVVRTIEGFEAPHCQPWIDVDTCGYVSRQEWILWVFEIANITLFVILWAIFPPGKYLPRDDRIFLDQMDGKTERVGPGFSQADQRPWWQTVVDPFNVKGAVTGRGMAVRKFWEEEQPVYTGGPLPKEKRQKKNGWLELRGVQRTSDEVKLNDVA